MLSRIPVVAWLCVAAVVALMVAAGLLFQGGRKAERVDDALRGAAATVGTEKAGAAAQKDLDNTVQDIGDRTAAEAIETVRVVERAKKEVRDAAAAEPDPLPRLDDFARRTRQLRGDLGIDRPAGADGDGSGGDPR